MAGFRMKKRTCWGWLLGLAGVLVSGSALALSISCEGQVVAEYRLEFLEKTPQGLYRVQEFYPSGEAHSDPYLIHEEELAQRDKVEAVACITVGVSRGTVEGDLILRDKGGEMYATFSYHNGRITRSLRHDSVNGWWVQIRFDGKGQEDRGRILYLDSQGNRLAEGRVLLDIYGFRLADGHWKIWDADGSLRREGSFKASLQGGGFPGSYRPTGLWTHWCKGVKYREIRYGWGKVSRDRWLIPEAEVACDTAEDAWIWVGRYLTTDFDWLDKQEEKTGHE